MKSFISLLMLLIAMNLSAQKYDVEPTTRNYPTANQLKYTIYSIDYQKSKTLLEEFIKGHKYLMVNQNETRSSHNFEFMIPDTDVALIDSVCNTLGYVSSKNLNSYNNELKLHEARLELERLEKKKAEYEKMLAGMQPATSDKHYEHWEKVRVIESDIYLTLMNIKRLESVRNQYTVSVSLNDEQSSPSSSKVNFVHMPGVEYAALFVENPAFGVSHPYYQGIFLKYLFTKGKDYFSLGALKPLNPTINDSTAYDEMFTFTFGQDWYNRHFGRGKNKFLNLYIGYEAGLAVCYKEDKPEAMAFVSPGTGLELYKNKFILVDTKVNYFLPLDGMNRNLRGWRVAASFNFTF